MKTTHPEVIESYVLDLGDFPFRFVAVIRTRHGDRQASCVTYWGARRWITRWRKRIEAEAAE